MRFVVQNVAFALWLLVTAVTCTENGKDGLARSNGNVAPNNDYALKKSSLDQNNRLSSSITKRVNSNNNEERSRGSGYLLSKQPACAEDVRRMCDQSILHNNFAVLDCIQNYKSTEEADLSPECHHLLWAYKRNSTKDIRFAEAADQVCNGEIEKLSECRQLSGESGSLLSCLMDAQENITNAQCKQFLNKMESIVFSDYRLIYKFAESCDKDIEQFHCGRLEMNDNAPHSQGSTIECLSKNPKELSSTCQHEILRVAELQSEDFHLDRPLYFACREDRERFCDSIQSGDGKVYRCLIRHKSEKDFSTACRDKLTQRQTLTAFDYKINKGLAKACREDIRAYRCRDDTSKNREIRLAQILRCLENNVHKGYPVASECQAEMLDHRRSLMEDYRLSPNVVFACKDEIAKFCSERLEGNSKTIHCLMSHARATTRKKKRISETCKKELEDLVHQTNIGEDWRVDPVLKEACESVVRVACSDIKPGEGRVLSCLMDNIGSNQMIDDCEEKLLQIQYFVARDYRLDPRLYRFCQADAKHFCNAGDNWAEDPLKMGPERGPIFPCLFRYAFHPKEDHKLTVECNQEVKRVMRQRAISVDLHPEIERMCLNDLADLCLEKVNKGEELECLQQKLEKLTPECQSAIGNYTEEEAEHIELNSLLFRACEPYVKQYCEEFLVKDVDEGDIIQCLLQHKNENNLKNNHKCYTYLEHFQLISLKDYRFTFKFKEACKKDVLQHCKTVKTKPQVVACLSELVRNDSIQDRKPRVSKECRQQLRVELFQRNENIKLDPKLEEACSKDRSKFCGYMVPGNAQVLECLKDHQKELSTQCHRLLFDRQVKDAYENGGVDYVLMTVCRPMLKLYCEDDQVNPLACLREKKDNEKFDPKCRGVVLKRLAQQNIDYRLNPQLRKACSMDVNKFCYQHIRSSGNDDDRTLEGKVIECLKGAFINQRLSSSCEKEVGEIIRQAQLDYRQDPVLAEVCKDEINSLCSQISDNDGNGEVEECLKIKFQTSKITNLPCRKQIAKLIQEGSADIHVDPILFKACILDIHHFCANVPAGKGKQLKCLLDAAQNSGHLIQEECKVMLDKRVQMFKSAAQVSPVENVEDIVIQVIGSPARNYLMVVALAIVGSIFIGGLFCGRITKRVHYDMKRK